ncbi:MAG: hypothetical protein JXA57_17740 [Armatimonadetes bacterium]|nr:hypothetical protein [Armatimonadota bacterium]
MTKAWWKAAGIRALKTFAQSIVSAGIVIPSLSAATDWMSAGWTAASVLAVAAGAAFFSLMTSITGLPELQLPEDPE